MKKALLAISLLLSAALQAADEKKAVTYEGQITGVVCVSCKAHITGSLTQKLPGVISVDVKAGDNADQQKLIIVAKNEATDIPDCIRSVHGLASEVIVFDSGSTDGTPTLCRDLGAKVVETDWPGDGPQKNRALDIATGDWVLCLDADERVGQELRTEIEAVLRQGSPHTAFRMPRSSSFCGKFMKHSGWWPDYIIRLFKRGEGRFTEVFTHTHLEHRGTLGTFRGPVIHLAIPELAESLEKMNAYSTAGARTLAAKGKTASVSVAAIRGLWMFFRVYILKRGFLDGREGFLLAVLNAEGTFHKYAKLAIHHGGKR